MTVKEYSENEFFVKENTKSMKNKKEITKKEYILYLVIVLCVTALAIALVAVAAILQKIGVDNVVYTVIGLSSFPILIFGVVFAVLKLGKMQKYALNKKVEKTELICLDGASKTKIIDYCERKKYNLIENKYYHKRRFSLFNDYINYFIRCADKDGRVGECLKREIDLFDGENRKEKHKCLLIVLFSDQITKEDLSDIKNFSLPIAAHETYAKMVGVRYDTVVVALGDNNSGKLYAFNEHKHSVTINSSGINLLRKMIK